MNQMQKSPMSNYLAYESNAKESHVKLFIAMSGREVNVNYTYM